VIHALISGISQHFNNLLMGIWGNATLIRMQPDTEDALHAPILQMEHLIQSGAFLIHMVMGYLGERRTSAKKIRLNQLISQISGLDGSDGKKDEAPWNLEARLKWASRIQQPRMIAGSAARVLEVLFKGIQAHCDNINSIRPTHTRIAEKMDRIATLVARGFGLIDQLRLYAGDTKAHPTKIRLGHLVKRLVARNSVNHLQVRITCRITAMLGTIRFDRKQLEWALQQIITNAVEAISHEGVVEIVVQPLLPVGLKARCGAQKPYDHVVVTIADSGPGICPQVRQHMFEPFYAAPRRHTKKGLGLAAVDGILKANNGHIRIQSEKGRGTAVTLYLPVTGTSL
jgi:signal transduction histidine kinase